MGICLGNLNTREILSRLGVELEENTIKEMENKRSEYCRCS